MNPIRFIFLSVLSFVFLSGFLFEERGMTLPAPEKKPKVAAKKIDYDFPLLKLKAHPVATEKTKDKQVVVKQPTQDPKEPKISKSRVKEKSKSTSQNPFKSLVGMFKGLIGTDSDSDLNKKPSVAPKKRAHPSKRIKKTIKEKSLSKPKITVKAKKKHIKPRRRKSGHANKLIFNKNSSLKDIPLPLPKMSSLKLKSLSKVLPSIPASKIPILNTIIPKGSKTAKRRIKRKNDAFYSTSSQNNHAKKSSSTNLDMANIRIGNSSDYTTLIFDSYVWGGYNTASTQEASSSGAYEFKYEPENNRIVASLQGYSAFSALLGDQSKLFSQSDVIKNIYIDRYIGEGNIQFIIDLKKKVKITVLDVQDPGRIIVTLYPK